MSFKFLSRDNAFQIKAADVLNYSLHINGMVN
jgi:hypothetical protein